MPFAFASELSANYDIDYACVIAGVQSEVRSRKDRDVVRRILGVHFRPETGCGGPSWLSFIGHTKDSLWSLDLFRCESAILRTYWVLAVMDQFTRRIVGFAVHRGVVDGLALGRMFHRVIRTQTPPKYLSSDHDPLYQFHQWQANLRVLDVKEIKTVPYVPLSHPFVERLKWDDSSRIPGPNIILDGGRPGGKTPRFSALFQSASRTLGLGRRVARAR